ncbi:DUF3710 domain-containing protein [Phytoactinopolyspora limicola]|uniref:DUF3710 domain-containing protein n=1 Tax=Phytoactinopolyspora limicola TaxID=2715536 RepID=UPI0014079DF0|nr:DUF3710 domain-containing protein [Phytoactinopolyspora limicola]
MFRRRRRDEQSREPRPDNTAAESAEPEATSAADPSEGSGPADRPNGPYDSTEVDLDTIRTERIDLGGLLIRGVEGMKIQLQVDKRSGRGTSVLLAVGEAAVQLVAVAAPRSSGLWEQTRLQITTDAQRRGGSAQEGTGPFGTEVRLVIPVTTKDGKKGAQPSRVSGIDGPRWMVRATFLGKAITDAAAFQRLVDVVRQVVVVRGDTPMPPGEVIALQPPGRKEADTDVEAESDVEADDVEADDDAADDVEADDDAGPTITDAEAGPDPEQSEPER